MLLDIARKTIDEHRMLERGPAPRPAGASAGAQGLPPAPSVGENRVVVAVSGGPDSVALLDVLTRLRPEYGLDLHIAHLNHMLRAGASQDAEFVRSLAADLNLPVIVESADVRAIAAAQKLSVEHAARNARREFLLRAAASVNAARIALGHHADDRVETVVMRLLRGTGLDGLAGMRPVALPFIRPFFDVTRAQIEQYIAERVLAYREDPSNRDPAFLRNRVRHELMPLIEGIQPGARAALLRLSELAQQESAWMFVEAATYLVGKALAEEAPQRMTLRLAALSRIIVPAMRARVVREAMRRVLGRATDVEQTHVEAVLRLAMGGKTGGRVSLPHGLIAERGYGTLVLRIGDVARSEPIGEFVLEVPGVTAVPPLGISMTAQLLARRQTLTPVEEPPNAAQFDYANTPLPLAVRTWRRGDRFHPLGMAGSMKVHDFFVNQKVPRADRGRVPVVTAGGDIAWIVGWRIDDRFKVTEATQTVLRLEATPLATDSATPGGA